MTETRVSLAIGTLTTLLLIVGAQQSEAQTPRPYCMQGGTGTTGGMADCSFSSMQQCLATLSGGEGTCSANPALAWRSRYQGAPARRAWGTVYR